VPADADPLGAAADPLGAAADALGATADPLGAAADALGAAADPLGAAADPLGAAADPLDAVVAAAMSADPVAPAFGEPGAVAAGGGADDRTGEGVTEASAGSGSVVAAGADVSSGALFAASLASSRLAASCDSN
jgi:hypothetical protein